MGFSLKSITIAKKDLVVEFRSKQTLNFMFLFSLLVLMLFSFTMGYSGAIEDVGAGLLWLIFIFTGISGMSRSFIREEERGTLDGIKLSPMGMSSLLLGKILYNFVLIFILQCIIFPLFIVLLNYPVRGDLLSAFFILTLGNIGFVIVCSALSVLVLNARARELLLPVILLPIVFPLLSAATSALKGILSGLPLSGVWDEIVIISIYIVIFFTIGILTFDYSIEG
ncbi:MAG: heme exporter protein CcmB [Candidatus Syntropharchaeia archaeon]